MWLSRTYTLLRRDKYTKLVITKQFFCSSINQNYTLSMPKANFEKDIPQEVASHFGQQPHKFVPIEKQTFYCKDSRGDSENFGAPGGDFGEFLLALNLYNEDLDEEAVDELLEKWLKERCSKERPFYLHSDRPAVQRLLKSIGQEHEENPLEIKDESTKLTFIEHFGKGAEFQGCGHLRLILENPEGYSLNLILFSHLSKAFFSRLFKGDDRVMFKVYEIPQDGCALVVVNGSAAIKTSILSTQCINAHQVFILNQHAVSGFRKQFIVPFFFPNDPVKQAEMLEAMETIGWRNAMMSANSLAGGKPIYKVDITEDLN